MAEGSVDVIGPVDLPVRVTAGQRLEINKDAFVELKQSDKRALAKLRSVFSDKRSGVSDHPKSDRETLPSMPAKTERKPGRLGKDDAPDGSPRPLTELRGMVLDGRYADAESGLDEFLQLNPHNAAAWSLLGDCRRKQAKWGDALGAYREVINKGNASQSNRARYLAGVLAQDNLGDHERAEALFEAYLSQVSDGQSDNAAMMRLAISKIALGKRADARRLLNNIVASTRDDTVRRRAERLLEDTQE